MTGLRAMLLMLALGANPLAQGVSSSHAAMAMGFDQEKTTHHFHLFTDGGAIGVSVKDLKDRKNLEAIRAHLPHIVEMFKQGDFSVPMLVHQTPVPGAEELKRSAARIGYRYSETPAGGRVDIVSTDTDALKAVHAFLTFQITDHKTGDSLEVTRRR
jgi:hypothetical protein